MRVSEFDIKATVDKTIAEHIKKNIPFTECMFRPGSLAFTEFYKQVRERAEELNLDWEDQELIATDLSLIHI